MDEISTPDESRTRTRQRQVVVGVLAAAAVAAALGGLWWRSYRTSPEAAVARIASAAVSRDVDTVVAHVDTTSVADQAVDDILGMTDSDAVTRFLKERPGRSAEEYKAKARALINEEMREHVATGTLPKRIPLDADSVKSLVAGAYARNAVRSVEVDGDSAHVTAVVSYGGKRLTVRVLMRHDGSTWVVKEIENLPDVLKQAGF
jgi:hypothetical protein